MLSTVFTSPQFSLAAVRKPRRLAHIVVAHFLCMYGVPRRSLQESKLYAWSEYVFGLPIRK